MSYFSFILRCYLIAIFIFICPINVLSQQLDIPEEKTKGNLPQNLESALTSLIEATLPQKPYPSTTQLDAIVQFVLSNKQQPHTIKPATRAFGKGIFYTNTIATPLPNLLQYILTPCIPGETIYPTSIRRNEWTKKSNFLQDSTTFLNIALPPQRAMFSRGLEYEETTPDISSGCYYHYMLNRLFILYAFKGQTVFFSISFMPMPSSVGLRGSILGKDDQWEYVYSAKEGTNLSMLSWAKTYIYGSASVTIYIQRIESATTDIYMFKWTNAGWSGMNVVTTKHIRDGVIRFVSGLKQVMESPNLPSVQSIIQKKYELNKMSLSELHTALKPFALRLAQQSLKDPILSKKFFQEILKDGIYVNTLTKENTVAELLKLYIKQQINKTR